jgi:cytochrome P450
MWVFANRDEDVFKDPDAFRLDRDLTRICFGALAFTHVRANNREGALETLNRAL